MEKSILNFHFDYLNPSLRMRAERSCSEAPQMFSWVAHNVLWVGIYRQQRSGNYGEKVVTLHWWGNTARSTLKAYVEAYVYFIAKPICSDVKPSGGKDNGACGNQYYQVDFRGKALSPEMEASPDVLLPLLAITVLVLLLSLPNIRLVYQVYNFENVLIISPTGVFQISKNKLKVSLIDNSLLLCLLTSGVIDTFFNFFNLRLNLSSTSLIFE